MSAEKDKPFLWHQGSYPSLSGQFMCSAVTKKPRNVPCQHLPFCQHLRATEFWFIHCVDSPFSDQIEKVRNESWITLDKLTWLLLTLLPAYLPQEVKVTKTWHSATFNILSSVWLGIKGILYSMLRRWMPTRKITLRLADLRRLPQVSSFTWST